MDSRLSVILPALLALSACAVTPKHISVMSLDLPELLPVRNFVANTDYTDAFSLSPEGDKLVYKGVSRLRPAILWRDVEGTSETAIRFRKDSPWPFWAANNRHILYVADDSGRENLHVYAIDTDSSDKVAVDLTPYPNTRAWVTHVPGKASNLIFVMHNRRDATRFDLYSIDLITREETLLFENTDNVLSLLIDDEGSVRARLRQHDTTRTLEVPDGTGWRSLGSATVFDQLWPIDLSADGQALYAMSNVGRDLRAFMSIDLGSGEQRVLYEHDQVDVDGVLLSPVDRKPLLAYSSPDYPELHFFDKTLEGQ